MPKIKKVIDGNGNIIYPITITDGVYDIANSQRLSTTLTGKADKSTTYTKTEVDNIVGDCAYIGDDDGSAVMVDPPITPQSIGFGIGTCSTAAGTAAKVVTLANYELVVNGFVAVSFVEDVPANATLNINGAGAKPIFYKGEAIVENAISGGDTVTFVYDGTNYVVASPLRVNKVTIRTWSDSAKTTPVSALLNITLPGKPVNQVRIGVTGTVTLYSIDGNATLSCYGAELNVTSFTVNGDTTVDIVVTDIQYVDLGFPSGTLWATGDIVKNTVNGIDVYSIGAPTDIGCYFSWGNIEGHNTGDGYQFNQDNYEQTPGYQLTASISADDDTHDAALKWLGEGWHLPTLQDMQDLINPLYTTMSAHTETDPVTGTSVSGVLVTSISNGNSIFVRYRLSGATMMDANRYQSLIITGNGTKLSINGSYKRSEFNVRGVL